MSSRLPFAVRISRQHYASICDVQALSCLAADPNIKYIARDTFPILDIMNL